VYPEAHQIFGVRGVGTTNFLQRVSCKVVVENLERGLHSRNMLGFEIAIADSQLTDGELAFMCLFKH
jgi:hypothetical protein